MGIGGALMWPAILGMTFALLPEEKAGLAGGIILGAAGLGNAIGPLIGGVLTDAAELALDLLPQRADLDLRRRSSPTSWSTSRSPRPSDQRIDYPGIAALSVGLVSLLIALDQVDDWGWGDPRVIGAAGAGGDPGRRLRADRAPRRRARPGAAGGDAQRELHAPPAWRSSSCRRPSSPRCSTCRSSCRSSSATRRWRPGSGCCPSSAPSPSSPSSPGRSTTGSGRSRWPCSAPPASRSPRSSSRRSTRDSGYGSLVPGMVVLGIGIGSFYPTATTAGVTSVDESQTSLAGGIVYMFQIAGGSIGLGLTTTVFSAAIPPFVDGIQAAFRLDAALSLVGFLIALFFVGGSLLARRRRPSTAGLSLPSSRRCGRRRGSSSPGRRRTMSSPRPPSSGRRRGRRASASSPPGRSACRRRGRRPACR